MALALVAAVAPVLPDPAAQAPPSGNDAPAERRHAIGREIERLRFELQKLRDGESGVLGAIERTSAEMRLRDAELREVSMRLGRTEAALEATGTRLDTLRDDQRRTREYLVFRLREAYKQGRHGVLRRWIGGEDVDGYLDGLRYAAWLNQRDARELREFRLQRLALDEEARRLESERAVLVATRREAAAARARLRQSRASRARLLERIRRDADLRQGAVEELERASRALTDMVEGAAAGSDSQPASAELDIHRFRGLLDPPTPGQVSAGFGRAVHPRFGTEVPHPGLDLEADAGRPIHCVFDGRVLFASWLQGYGLTAIVDHGGGVVSIYAHASVLLVSKGDPVRRGDSLGRVGETGSLRGPYLYFEMRQDGVPVDPELWLRRGK